MRTRGWGQYRCKNNVLNIFSFPGSATAAGGRLGRGRRPPGPGGGGAAAAAGGESGGEGVDELPVERHVDEGVQAAVEGEQPEEPAERRH